MYCKYHLITTATFTLVYVCMTVPKVTLYLHEHAVICQQELAFYKFLEIYTCCRLYFVRQGLLLTDSC